MKAKDLRKVLESIPDDAAIVLNCDKPGVEATYVAEIIGEHPTLFVIGAPFEESTS